MPRKAIGPYATGKEEMRHEFPNRIKAAAAPPSERMAAVKAAAAALSRQDISNSITLLRMGLVERLLLKTACACVGLAIKLKQRRICRSLP